MPANVADRAEVLANGLIDDPKDYFDSLSPEQQDRVFGKANAEAIRAGADMSLVVNSKRGMSENGLITKGGRKWGRSPKVTAGRPTPEQLMRWAEGDRAKFGQLLKEHGYTLPSSPAGGGGGKPPKPPGFAWPGPEPHWDGPHPPPNSPSEDRAYWLARQKATGINDGGETLKPREVLFVERMNALSEEIRWIPRGGSGTSDFWWLSNDSLVIELKSVASVKYSSISDSIKAAVRDARLAFAAPKEHFVIDLGTSPITDKVRSQLSLYNHRRSGSPENQIRSLWVMHSNGVLEQIILRQQGEAPRLF